MRHEIHRGLTGLPISVAVYSDAEIAAFRTALHKAGVADEYADDAVAVMPMLDEWMPVDAAEVLAAVVHALDLPPDKFHGAAMAVRAVRAAVERGHR